MNETTLESQEDDLPAYKWPVKRKLYATFTSLYFYANVLYVVYSIAIYCDTDSVRYSYDDAVQTKYDNDIYFKYGIVHVVSACFYLFAWIGFKNWYEIEVWPDYLNVVGSALWFTAACYYPNEYVTPTYSLDFYNASYYANVTSLVNVTEGGKQVLMNVTVLQLFQYLANNSVSNDDGFGYSSQYYLVRKLELAAAVLEVVAAPLWVWAWYTNYRDSYECLDKPTAARGWTFDDPDFHANWSILACTILYLVYECEVYVDKASFGTNYLYELADLLYLLNSLFYLLGCLRDFGWLWFMPAWGRLDASWREVEYTTVSVSDTDLGGRNDNLKVEASVSVVVSGEGKENAKHGQPMDPTTLLNDSFAAAAISPSLTMVMVNGSGLGDVSHSQIDTPEMPPPSAPLLEKSS